MEGRHLDITVVSAKDLKKVNLIGKMNTYAVVWVDPYYRQSTSVDDDGGSKPEWNQKLSFPVPEDFFQQPNSRLTVEIYSKATFTDDKLVGAVNIPLPEVAQKTNQEEVAEYGVMRKSGKAKGTLKLSIRMGEKTTIGPAPAGQGAYGHAPAAVMPVATYSHDGKQHGAPHDDKSHDAAAMAVPYGYPPAGAPPAPYGYPPQVSYPQPYGAYGGQAPGYYQQPPPQQYYAQPPPNRRPGFGGGGGGMGMGLGAGLLAGAVGGLIVGDMVDDAFDGGCDF
ncbi:hypothetical protein L7F22_068819 [Adiantum nelumboides]|nr:hypothetical protein [Adiantum nelumboides]MCO5614536.1 hypothetical protein [Adiantum nelumboides]